MTAQPFHPLDIPIHGTNLIEASAGTGKTWGIAALFTRLIVLEKMPVEQILVVTFTKAATAELKTRLRGRRTMPKPWPQFIACTTKMRRPMLLFSICCTAPCKMKICRA